ncbi:hypothetical protein Sste5346_007068 [Sporothrix stenoceras]|uniref:BTB domain transcription factor n=1 Tax=Sporothrix stenoceras TaxID=5173 RepID=A0ABR3YVB5_9PEZI
MVETRHGTRTTGASDAAASNSGTKQETMKEKQPETDNGPKEDKTKDSTESTEKPKDATEVKDEPADEKVDASAGDKHKPADRSQSPEDSRKRQKIEAENSDSDAKVKKEDFPSDNTPTILERGNIYFFFRARVNIDEPNSLDDVARTYLVLRPEVKDGHGHGNSKDGDCSKGHTRLLALPKKVLPRTGRDRFMAFVLAADESYANLQKEFLSGSQEGGKGGEDDDNEKDKMERHFPPATAFGEGVYAIISTGRESHLAYVLTVPEKLGSVQQQLGLVHKQGCFIVSTKNPAYPMPGGAKMVGGGPDYPKEINKSFRKLRWAPLRPEHLDYVHSHMLLVGESKGVERLLNDEHGGRELSAELDELADDDLDRMRRLGSTEAEAVFASLHTKEPEGQPEKLSKVFE